MIKLMQGDCLELYKNIEPKRIEEIQRETAYPNSISVQQALLKVWNECEQEKAVKNNAVSPFCGLA